MVFLYMGLTPEAPTGVSASGNQSPPYVVSQVAHGIQIPLSYADAIIWQCIPSSNYRARQQLIQVLAGEILLSDVHDNES
ncbi:hypothetical protein GUJ93_ZPchr0003g18499 [Zizania palustris]|uniref:Uncharacterized protein n=1 Tax=Zizania palustris TaxID=103762 RepID=A0A8J5RYE2_ZIZPA|nr:hypothetical protein GUJ93_ZPchr0003g18499 [Zizania palustris]